MIKHQVEVVNVSTENCPLHSLSSQENNNTIDSQDVTDTTEYGFDDDVMKNEVVCLCETDEINPSPTSISPY
jgi:hypothetical protein